MFADAPNWADIKTANATYTTMIATWVAAGATCLGAIVAGFALKYARDAATAAQGQIKAIERQVELSEPRPVVILKTQNKSLQFENIGEDIAIDLQASELMLRLNDSQTTNVQFLSEVVVRPGEQRSFRYREWPRRGKGIIIEEINYEQFFESVSNELSSRSDWIPDKEGRSALRPVTLTYRNVRGKEFIDRFVIGVRDGKFECWPELPLFSDKKPQNDKA